MNNENAGRSDWCAPKHDGMLEGATGLELFLRRISGNFRAIEAQFARLGPLLEHHKRMLRERELQ